jgi:hypothetical protein
MERNDILTPYVALRMSSRLLRDIHPDGYPKIQIFLDINTANGILLLELGKFITGGGYALF